MPIANLPLNEAERNPKSEARISKEIRKPNSESFALGWRSGFELRASDFFRISALGFRVSQLPLPQVSLFVVPTQRGENIEGLNSHQNKL